ncbi:DUF2326 domain-containing protein [Desulfothermus okinawensis JCM 13304]
MIRLKRLYSETGLFDEVKFKEGLNIILGKYSSTQKEINGIGKSTLIRLVDYCLLSQTAKNKFFNVKTFPFLDSHNVVLEFYMQNEIYFIKRWFNKKEILFGKMGTTDVHEYSEKELKSVLADIFFKAYNNTYYENKWFRSLIKFFIKDDLNHQVRKVPYNFLHPNITKNLIIVYNSYLMGLPNKNLYQLEMLKRKLQESKKIQNRMIEGLEKETGKHFHEIKSELREIKEKIQTLENAIKDYNFINTYKDMEDRIGYLTNKISKKLLEIQKIQRKLDSIQESYAVNVEVDIKESTKFYSMLNAQLGAFLKKNLEEVIKFRKAIANNRKKYLAERERELKDKLNELWKDYYELEEERKKLYKILDTKGRFDIIKEAYKKLLEEGTAFQYIENIIKQIDGLSEEILRIEKEMSDLHFTIVKELKEYSEKINNLGMSFRETVKNCTATSEGSYLAIEYTNKKENPVDIRVDIPKSLSYGRERLKILVYDLTIFKEILNHRGTMPHFLIHDGVLHGIDLKTKIRILNYIFELLKKSNNQAQYIITLNEGDVMSEYEEEKLSFNLNEHIIIIYEDNPQKMIFKIEF